MSDEHETYSPEAGQAKGAHLRELRHAARWSQVALAAKMSARGFPWHATTVARTENGLRRLRFDEVDALANIFSVPLESIGRAA